MARSNGKMKNIRTKARDIIFILGDQLTPSLPNLMAGDPTLDVVIMAEVQEEASYVGHHKKKLAFVFSAMRHFAHELRDLGWRVEYRTLNETGPTGSLRHEIQRAVEKYATDRVIVTEPGEWRVRQDILCCADALGVTVDVLEDERFICSREDFANWARGRQQLRMEYFYREMRRKTGLLMDGDKPEGGLWNFDKENRKPARPDLFIPRPFSRKPDKITRGVLALVAKRFPDNFGDLEPFWFAVTRRDAEAALAHFLEVALPYFGDFQDAMLADERFLYHGVVSLYLNAGLLDPLHVCRKVEDAYRQGDAPINAAEGFIRQILGWREYVHGIYWLKMPGYLSENFFGHNRPVPEFYWTGETDLFCLGAAIDQTKAEAYAHHIQRLMITGNFALLSGVSPQALHEWYLAAYADAYEWVELPNTLGMSQFGDGGLLASKPYVASGAYINRMSDYCKNCRYDVKQRSSPDACPFNSLYWQFLSRHRDKLSANPRMAQMYRTWDRMNEDARAETLSHAEHFLHGLT